MPHFFFSVPPPPKPSPTPARPRFEVHVDVIPSPPPVSLPVDTPLLGLDDHGQPLNRTFNRDRRWDRASDELIGLAKGITCDGVVTDAEIFHLAAWLERHAEFASEYPFRHIIHRMRAAVADDVVDEAERKELGHLLLEISGGIQNLDDTACASSLAIFDTPAPAIIVEGRTFVFTGRFASATRSHCEMAVLDQGGISASRITRDTDYLVVGVIGSADWIHSTHGRKIQKALDYRGSSGRPWIVTENHWLAQIGPL